MLIVQGNALSSFPQSFFPGPGVSVAGDSIPLLTPCGKVDHMPLGLRWDFEVPGTGSLSRTPTIAADFAAAKLPYLLFKSKVTLPSWGTVIFSGVESALEYFSGTPGFLVASFCCFTVSFRIF